MTMRILVTGAEGFIGSHLVERLIGQGHDVRAFILYNSFNSWGWLEDLPSSRRSSLDVFPGDIRDPFGVREAMRGCDVVLHLAALISIPFSYHSPQNFIETNITGTLNVLQAARDLNVRRVVHTSTSEVYGTARTVPISEEHPLQGQSPYSASKIGADQMALAFYRSFGLPVTIARPFNTYGPRQSARAVIPAILTQALAGRPVKLGSLHPTRDFTFVTDTAAGLSAMATADGVLGEVVNLGSEFELSIGDLAKLIASQTGLSITLESDGRRQRPTNSEVERLWCDAGKARRLIGWAPAYAGVEGLRRGITVTHEWLRRPENLARYKAEIYNI